MAVLKAFRGLRPPKNLVTQLASPPYDVLNSEEARVLAKGNPYSLLHVIKPEIDLPEDLDHYSPLVYEKAKENFKKFKDQKWLAADDDEYLYIYAQTMNGKTQYGIVGCASVNDYMNGVIKRHELTRKDKEEDRMKHVRVTNANMEPVFFSYPAVNEIDNIVADFVENNEAEYDFTTLDGFGHHFWVINEQDLIHRIIDLFEEIPSTYVADGHHRTAAAALVGNEKRMANPNHTGDEEYNYFLAVHFPANQLTIIDYNRVIKDLNGLTKEEFLSELENGFDIKMIGKKMTAPEQLHCFTMYLGGEAYSLKAKNNTYNDNDPIDGLDVTILTKQVLEPILNIHDLRTDVRIDFVGGIRGLGELEKRVDSGEMAVAFALYPVSMDQLINIADSGKIMPPKTTWFEPKLRSGLIVHELE
ncbi:MAG: DUF1015 domain-containing protein [Bacteroidales bacterium]|nr:DUF1015 domain-containing protein [Bacteroidales bacterium]